MRTRTRTRGLYLEVLEDRVTPNGSFIHPAGPEFRANTYTTNYQTAPAVAALTGGGFVVTWQSEFQDGSDHGVYGQRYAADGSMAGPEFRANTYTTNSQFSPAVAALAGGGFVVTWTSAGQDGSGFGVYGQRYAADGTPAGPEFRAITYIAADYNYQAYPAVAALAGGGFVVTWEGYGLDGSTPGVYGQRYAADGSKAGPEFRANTYITGYQHFPAVAALAGGGFVVTWQSFGQDGSGFGVYGQWYAADGTPAGPEFRANTYTTGYQVSSAVAALAGGGFVVTWHSDQDGSGLGVYGQRYAADGTTAGPESRANATTAGNQYAPAVAALTGGGFVVTWQSEFQDGSDHGVYGQRYAADGSMAGPEFRANTTTAYSQWDPAVAALAGGGFVVAWQSELQDGSGSGVLGQRYAVSASNASPLLHASVPDQAPLLGEAISLDLAAHFRDPDGDRLTYAAALAGGGPLPPGLALDAAGRLTGTAAQTGRYAIAVTATDLNGATAGATVNLPVSSFYHPAGPEFRANTATVGEQAGAAVAALAGGGFVVTWHSEFQDGSGSGVYGQRYAADGTPAGPEFRTNTTTGYQWDPAVAGLGGGGFVVTWQSEFQDGSGLGVYGQRYAADGSKAGPEFRANTYTTNSQHDPAVGALAGGGFVVTWTSLGQDGRGFGVYGQRYAADGTPAGPEFRANTTTAGHQSDPAVAALAGGGFVVTWESDQDGSTDGYGQRYAADGTPAGPEFRANTYTTGYQGGPVVAALAGGGFVVTWSSRGQDGSDYGVYGQRYAADGTPAGPEFRANTYTTGHQVAPAVAGLAGGGFVVTWTSYGQDGSGLGVYGQRYELSQRPNLVGGLQVNGGQAQRSRLTTLTLTYDAVLDTARLTQPGAFTLTRLADGAAVGAVTVAATIDGGRTTIVLTFGGAYTEFGSLADGRWVLTVNRNFVRTPDGPSLAADYTSPVFHRLYGDANGDGVVNGLDLAAFRAAFGSSIGSPAYVVALDYDGDGAINGTDLTQFRNRFGWMV